MYRRDAGLKSSVLGSPDRVSPHLKMDELVRQDDWYQAASDEQQEPGLSSKVPLVFDDESLDSVLYDDLPAAPTPASIFAVAYALFAELRSAFEGSDFESVISLASRLLDGTVDLPRDIQQQTGQLLQEAIGGIRPFTVATGRERRSLWDAIGRLIESSSYADAVFQQMLPMIAYHECVENQSGPNIALETLADLGLIADRSGTGCIIFEGEVGEGIGRLAAAYRIDGRDAFLMRLRVTVTGIAAVSEAAGLEHLALAGCLNGLVRQMQDDGEHRAAVILGRRALDIRRAALRDDHRLVTQSQNNLGLSLVCLGELQEAEKLLLAATSGAEPFPNPFYWLARLYKERTLADDESREKEAWRSYLRLGGTTEERKQEAKIRLAELSRHSRYK